MHTTVELFSIPHKKKYVQSPAAHAMQGAHKEHMVYRTSSL